MSDAISVECPQCHARLKLKSRSAVGKKVPCPKCKKPFVVKAPPEDDELGFMNVAEPEVDEFAGLGEGDGEEDELPAAPTSRGKQRGKKKSASAESSGESTKLLIIASGSIVAVGLLIAAGIFGIPLLADWVMSGNKIDTAWLPPDADLIVHARVADTWDSPLVQSLVSNQTVKPQLDVMWSKMGISPSRVASITFGASGVAARSKEVLSRGVPGMPGVPMGSPPPALGAPGPNVIVVRTKAIDDVSKIRDKFKNGRTGTHQGAEYLVPPVGGDIALHFASSDTFVAGTEQNLKLAIEWGRKGVRRADLDFVDPTQMVLIALVPKDPSLLEPPPSGPGGSPFGNLLAQSEGTRGKVKGICIGLSASDKLDWTISSNCNDKFAAEDVLKATEKSMAETKERFSKFKANVPPMLAEIVKLGDDIVASLQVSSTGAVVATRGSVPASVKSTVEKALPMILMMGAMGGQNPGGIPGMNPFAPPGAPGAQGFPIGADGQLPGNLPPGTIPTEIPGSLGDSPQGAVPPGTIPPGAVPPNGGQLNLPPPGGKQ